MTNSKQRTTQTQNTSQTERASTTPTNPSWVTGPIMDYMGAVEGLGDRDPQSFVAGPSQGQLMAFGNMDQLGGWRGQSAAASGALANILGQGAFRAGVGGAKPGHAGQMQPDTGGFGVSNGTALAQAHGYTAPSAGTAQQATSQGYNPTFAGNPAQAQAQTYQAPQLDPASLVSGQGYNAPNIGASQGYNAAQLGPATTVGQVNASTGTAAPVTLGQTQNATASQYGGTSVMDNFDRYQNPYMRDVVDATANDLSQYEGQVRAQQAANAARTGAFGGSRLAIREAETEGQLARARAATLGGLRAQGFESAAGLATQDANLRQGAGLFNAQNQTNVSLANADAGNQRNLTQGAMDLQRGMFNTGENNQTARLNANNLLATARGNADAINQFGLAQGQMNNQASRDQFLDTSQRDLARAGMQADALQFGANAGNVASLANASAQNQRGLAQGQLSAQALSQNAAAENAMRSQNADAQNRFGLFNADAGNQAAQFGAQAGNQASMFNTQQGNEFAQADAARQAQALQFGAGAQNAASGQNAAALNNMAQFNAGQQDNAANRGIQAAGMLGQLANQYGEGTRQDLGAMASLGEMQRNIEQQQRLAEVAQLQTMGQLYNPALLALFRGQDVNGTMSGTMNGTSTQTQSPSLFQSMLGLGSLGVGLAGSGLF